jgi:hypothetical protein
MKRDAHILAIPNEDGFGPPALLCYVVKEVLKQRPDCHVTIWNQSRHLFNESLYRDYICQGRVNVVPVWNLIQLDKDRETGNVSIPGTLRLIGDYRSASDHYPLIAATPMFDLVVEFGVPAAARWAAIRGFPSVSIFDHSWAKTLQMILEDADKKLSAATLVSDTDRAQWKRLVKDIADDEGFTKKLVLFPEFITPTVFLDHWKKTIVPSSISHLPGVLGGRPAWERSDAMKHFGLSAEGDILMIQGGDTAACAQLILKLVPAFLNDREQLEKLGLNVVIFVPKCLEDHSTIRLLRDQGPNFQRVRAFSPVPGGTIQEVLPFVKLLVTRAGGGTVNDAVACRTPFVCIPESTQSQVQAIFDACIRRGITRPILFDPAKRAKDAENAILRAFQAPANARLVENMKEISVRAEEKLVQQVLAAL